MTKRAGFLSREAAREAGRRDFARIRRALRDILQPSPRQRRVAAAHLKALEQRAQERRVGE